MATKNSRGAPLITGVPPSFGSGLLHSKKTIQKQHCKCIGFTPEEAVAVDEACGKAIQDVSVVLQKMNGVSVVSGNVPSDVALALKHHFKLDVSVPRKPYGKRYQDIIIGNITDVYRKIQRDLLGGMIYERSARSSTGHVAKLRPKVVHIDEGFFKYTNRTLRARAIIHEQAHYASRLPGALCKITDRGWWWAKAYYEINPDVYTGLTTDQALTNADNYAGFAFELAVPNMFYWEGGSSGQ